MDNATTEHLTAIVLAVMSLGPLTALTIYSIVVWLSEPKQQD